MSNLFWNYSLAVYAQPKVQEACLRLQENQGADVNLVLYCCWQGSLGHGLQADDVELLLELCEPWCRDVVNPLRELRVRLKGFGEQSVYNSVYNKAKQTELKAEQVQQTLLWRYTPAVRRNDCSPPPGQAKEAISNNLRLYWKILNSDDLAFQVLIEALHSEAH